MIDFKSAIKAAEFFTKKPELIKEKGNIASFESQKTNYYRLILEQTIKELQSKDSTTMIGAELAKAMREENFSKVARFLELAIEEYAESPKEDEKSRKDYSRTTMPKLPTEIEEEVVADIDEINKCISAGSYRAAIILCGRMLETVLHRKYYDITGRDLLETSPGIGLGNIIAKLRDNNFTFDPGLSEQIHLINQTRIYSVHKKKRLFKPTKEQTEAIVLYTVDAARKLLEDTA